MKNKFRLSIFIIFIMTASCAPGTVSPTATDIATATTAPTPTQSGPTKPTDLIDERLGAVIASYRDLGELPVHRGANKPFTTVSRICANQ